MPDKPDAKARLAAVSAIAGAVSVAGLAIIWVTSSTPWTPGNAVVAVGGIGMFAGWFGGIIAGLKSIRSSARVWAIVGIVLALASLAAFIVLITMLG